jgi:hypothetical protein
MTPPSLRSYVWTFISLFTPTVLIDVAPIVTDRHLRVFFCFCCRHRRISSSRTDPTERMPQKVVHLYIVFERSTDATHMCLFGLVSFAFEILQPLFVMPAHVSFFDRQCLEHQKDYISVPGMLLYIRTCSKPCCTAFRV